MPRSTQLDKEQIATSTPACQAGVLVVRRHQLLVRCSHWLNVPIVLGRSVLNRKDHRWNKSSRALVLRRPYASITRDKTRFPSPEVGISDRPMT